VAQPLTLDISAGLKISTFPLQRNQILLRVANINDHFDLQSLNTTIYFNVKDYATALWNSVNGNNNFTLNYVNIVETSLSANQPYTDMLANKVQWFGEADGRVGPQYPSDRANWEAAFQPQRIRVFSIEFISSKVTPSLTTEECFLQ